MLNLLLIIWNYMYNTYICIAILYDKYIYAIYILTNNARKHRHTSFSEL